jgi:hypothetical protein
MKRIFTAMLVAVALSGYGCSAPRGGDSASEFLQVESTVPSLELSQDASDAAVGRFRDFFSDVTAESVRAKSKGLYADDVYFNDTLKTLRGREAVEAYFLKTTEHVDSLRAEVVDVARSGGNYYVRWVMDVKFKGAKEPVRTIGMTLLRFNKEGRLTLHQDFWDSSAGFYEHLPVLGGVIRWIKSKI